MKKKQGRVKSNQKVRRKGPKSKKRNRWFMDAYRNDYIDYDRGY